MPNISLARLKELEIAEQHLKELQVQNSIKWVGDALGNAFATIMATKPWVDWSPAEQQVLFNVCGSARTAMYMYIDNLPSK